jgi:cytosine/adenosine deaminase-related metal-dependent hydrolase
VGTAAWQALIQAVNPPLIHTHVAECEAETHYLAGEPSEISRLHQQILNRTYQPQVPFSSPIQALLANDLLTHPSILAHAIETTAKDRRALQGKPVGIAHCPRSNMALHGKTLDWADWHELDIPIGLGTDGRLSTPDLDLREEARFAMRHHGWSAQQALKVLTHEGARALQMEAQIGSVEAGKHADFVLWQADPNGAQAPETLVLEPRTRVQTVIIDGQIRYQEALE